MLHTAKPTSPPGSGHDALLETLAATTISSDHPVTSEQRMRTGPETPLPCSADFAIYPLGSTVPFSKYIAKVEEILKQLELKYKVHEQGTMIHGEMMAVMHAVKCSHNAVHAMGCPRIVSNIRVDTGDKYTAVAGEAREGGTA